MLSHLVVQTLSDHAGWVLDCARILNVHHHGVYMFNGVPKG